ncbi:hypothetical protein BJV74DRAFT_798522 [Russula compacta]|nr:hypothetical protein BJV74DRAFT_798522 [Russula compacta]
MWLVELGRGTEMGIVQLPEASQHIGVARKKRAPRRRPIEGNESGGGGKCGCEGGGGGEAGIIRKRFYSGQSERVGIQWGVHHTSTTTICAKGDRDEMSICTDGREKCRVVPPAQIASDRHARRVIRVCGKRDRGRGRSRGGRRLVFKVETSMKSDGTGLMGDANGK